MTKHDAIIIGTGQAGPPLAVRLARTGLDTAIIERSLFGGTCVNYGCIPTKTLVASARAAHVARRAERYGVVVEGQVTVNMKRVKERKDEVTGQSNANIEKWLRGTDNLTVYEGHAQFEGPHTVRVADTVLEAPKIFINVGGRAHVPEMPGVDEVGWWTNSDMMHVDALPEHLVIVGGSYVGLEFAQMYRRFGSRVTVIERSSRLIPKEDDDISSTVREILEGEGVDVRLDAECIGVAKDPRGVRASLECEDPAKEVVGSHLLMAAGRRPNTDDLGLDHAGVEVDEQGYVRVNDALETNVPGVWALGDVNRRGAFTHTAYNDYEIVADNLLEGANRRVTDRIVTYGLFIDPPLGRVGMTETQAIESGRKVLRAKRPMSRVGRAREKGETQGLMKLMVDADSKEILGAAILGVDGDEAIHSVTGLMYAKAPYTVLQRAVHIHPTVAELLPTLAGGLEPVTAARDRA